ncbi:MAG: hypothetical protein AAF961_06110, partial [Planctomycetota bacterium]
MSSRKSHRLIDEQIITFEVFDYNEQPPELADWTHWFDSDPTPSSANAWGHDYDSGSSVPGAYNDTIYLTLREPAVNDPSTPTSTTLHLRLNRWSGNLYDDQTDAANLTYQKVSGPGPNGPIAGDWSWTIDHQDAGKVYKLVFEVTDNGWDGAGGAGEVLSATNYLYVKVDKLVDLGGGSVGYIEAPHALQHGDHHDPQFTDHPAFITTADAPAAQRTWTLAGSQSNGNYVPVFNEGAPNDAQFSIVDQPESGKGTVTLLDAADGTFRYDPPDADFRGVVRFT